MVGSKKIDFYRWIYKYFQECELPEDCPFQLSDILYRLSTDISMLEKSHLHTKERTISNNLRQEILKTMRELNAFDEKSAVSAKEIHEHNKLLASQRQVMGITNLIKGAITSGEVIKVPRPDQKTHVKYYLNKSE